MNREKHGKSGRMGWKPGRFGVLVVGLLAVMISISPKTPADGAENPRRMLLEYRNRLAENIHADRERKLKRFSSLDDWEARNREVRDAFMEMLGLDNPPEKTPLNPRKTGRLNRDGYVVEKIIFESRPRFYVTANLYLPSDFNPPFPAVLSPCGHTQTGKAHESYQRVYISLAKKGYAVLAFDPIGQAERLQYYDRDTGGGKSRVGGPTGEHNMCGFPLFLVGENLGGWRVWDAIRGVDYLESRSDIDRSRIACAGQSGGGRVTQFLAPVEPRIKIAVPVCSVAGPLRTWGGGDAEQNLPGIMAAGILQADYLGPIAPRPLLILNVAGKKGASVQDWDAFVTGGTAGVGFDRNGDSGPGETFKFLRELYGRMGAAEDVDEIIVPGTHSWSLPLREATYAWLNRFWGRPGVDDSEPEFEVELPESVWCTPQGQVSATFPLARTVQAMTRERSLALKRARPQPEGSEEELEGYREELSGKLKEVLGIPAEMPDVSSRSGRKADLGNGIKTERVLIDSEPGIKLPGVIYRAEGGGGSKTGPGLLWVSDKDKRPTPLMLQLIRAGYRVLAFDPRGMGETTPEQMDGRNRSRVETSAALNFMILGKNLLGMRVFDLLQAARYLRGVGDIDPERVGVVASGRGAIMAVMAAALDDGLSPVVAQGGLVSYSSLAESPIHTWDFGIFVPDILLYLDLPEAVACLSPRPIMIVNPLDAGQKTVGAKELLSVYRSALNTYLKAGASESLKLTSGLTPAKADRAIFESIN
ncbi:alpha/beta hydrolase family protein [candidate division KSB1 bacterium]